MVKEIITLDLNIDRLNAHGGIYKTMHRISTNYYWPGMEQDVIRYIKSCDVCKAVKQSSKIQVTPMGHQRITTRPWESLYMDFVGPFPRSKSGNVYLFVVIDNFSKFVVIHPIKEANTRAITKFLENNIFLVYGVPKIIIADNGSQFTSSQFSDLLERYKIKKHLVARYHPQANAAEAANKTIGTAIRA